MATMKCKCGGEIKELETFDTEVWEDRIILFKYGTCEKCYRPYRWEDYYTHFKTTEPEEDWENNPDLEENDGNLECGFDPYLGCYSDDC